MMMMMVTMMVVIRPAMSVVVIVVWVMIPSSNIVRVVSPTVTITPMPAI
jgi:hypothetical protein